MIATVAVCTWNRAEQLRITLESLSQQDGCHELPWEVIVVNNKCTDHTDDVIAAFAKRLPVRRVFQPKPGLSNARNAAAEQAAGDYIIFTDDDISFVPSWLRAYCDAFARHPEVAVFGGPIIPQFLASPPRWLRSAWPQVSTVYGERLLGTGQDPDIRPERAPFGANYAIRMREQRSAKYDPNLGLRHGVVKGGEETTLMLRLLSRGHRGRWVRDAVVFHRIPAAHMTARYVWRYHRGQGRGLVPAGPMPDEPRWFGYPRWMWRAWVTWEVVWRMQALVRPADVWVASMIKAAQLRGQLDESGAQARA